MPMVTRRSSRVFLYIFVLVVLLVTLFPFYWILNMSLQNNIELYDTPPHFFPPTRPSRTSAASCSRSGA